MNKNITIKVNESSRGKTPSCYVNKTFNLTYAGPNGTMHSYMANLKNGTAIRFTYFPEYPSDSPRWFVRKGTSFAGTWLHDVTVVG